MTKQKKSQITMLMILALVLFIAVGFILYISKSVVKKQSQQSVKKIEETPIEFQPIKEFVQKCLDKLAKDAVLLLGEQGGYIYRSQGGSYPDYLTTDEGKVFIKHNDNRVEYKVVYNIIPLKYDSQRFKTQPPDYPWSCFPYEYTPTGECDTSKEIPHGIFGMNEMPPLNPSGGIYSLQSQIGSFIDTNMDNCADFNIFEEQGLKIVMEPAKTSVIIGSNDISIKSKIPLTITNPTTEEFVYIEDFSTNVDVRLKRIYSFVHQLIENDITNIKFDIDSPQNDKNSLKVDVIKSEFVDRDSDDDIIIVTDEKSLIYGEPFQYVFARKNRVPALYYIKDNILEFPAGHEIKRSDLPQEPELKAEDPDEDIDTLTFNLYRGEFSTTPLPPDFSITLNQDQIIFKIEVTDGKLSDYQIITVNNI